MTVEQDQPVAFRNVNFVMSGRCLPYAEKTIESLTRQSRELLHINFITDSPEDALKIEESLAKLSIPANHKTFVYPQREADARASDQFAKYPHLATFRFGHPCWRKITDPILFAAPGEEMIILDPDLYFPNYFRFEKTPDTGLLLMWQRPHCMLPDETVRAAYQAPVKLAHHADIGVSQLKNRVDLEWLDWLIGRMGGKDIPRMMHVEPIIWSALAMKIGGGYLPPKHWHCWANPPWKQVLLRVGIQGRSLLKWEKFRTLKCFHAGGVAKWWLKEAVENGYFHTPLEITESLPIPPFEELTEAAYHSNRGLKRFAERLGYYKYIKRN